MRSLSHLSISSWTLSPLSAGLFSSQFLSSDHPLFLVTASSAAGDRQTSPAAAHLLRACLFPPTEPELQKLTSCAPSSIDHQSVGCKSGQSLLKFDSHYLLNSTLPCKMPKIKNLSDACKVSFSPDGPISEEALERVRALLDEIRPLDLGLDNEAQIARTWNSSTRQQNGRRGRGGLNQNASPIKYLHIHECESFSMGIFCMPPSSVIPLHNHPAMTVLSKLLYGKVQAESYDLIDVADPTDPLKPRPARCVRDREMTAPETTILYPDRGGNIHTFRAITPCALFDVLSPPYSAEKGRDCSYFRKSLVKEPSAVLPSEVDSSEVVWLEELEDHQPPEGFVVARGLYKGPVIRR